MNVKALNRAKELESEIGGLEDFMFWCSGRREGLRKYPNVVAILRRKCFGGIDRREYDLSKRLQERIFDCVEEELNLLKKELEEL